MSELYRVVVEDPTGEFDHNPRVLSVALHIQQIWEYNYGFCARAVRSA